MHDIVDVELVEEWVSVFGHRSSEDHNFIDLSDPFQESINARPFYDVYVVILPFDFNRNREVSLMKDLQKC